MGLAASLSLASAARADIVTFDNIPFPANTDGSSGALSVPNSFDNQGLNFYSVGYVIPKELSDPVGGFFPTPFSSNFYEYDTITDPVGLVITQTGGGLFDLNSLAIGLGLGYPGEATSDSLHVSWIRGGDCGSACIGGTDITLGVGFSNVTLGLTDLSSITFGDPSVLRYVAIDNVSFASNAAVLEPAAWAMMIAGFGGVGALMRRRGRGIAAATA